MGNYDFINGTPDETPSEAFSFLDGGGEATPVRRTAPTLKEPGGEVPEWRVRLAQAMGRDVTPYMAAKLGVHPSQIRYDEQTANWHVLHPDKQWRPAFPDRGGVGYTYSGEPGVEDIHVPGPGKNNILQGTLGALGQAPNLAGMMGGATVGSAGGPVGSIAGAGAGNYAAQQGKDYLGALVAPESGSNNPGLGDVGEGMAAEFGGKVLSKAGGALWDRAKQFGPGSLFRMLTPTEKALRFAGADATLSPEVKAGLESVFKGGAEAPVFTNPSVRALLNDAAQKSQPARNFIMQELQKMNPENRMLFGALTDMPGLVTGAGAGFGEAAVAASQKSITDANTAVESLTRGLATDQTPVDTQPLIGWIDQKLATGKLPKDAQAYLQQAKQMLTGNADPQAIRETLGKVAPGTGNLTESSTAALEGIQKRVQAEAAGIRAEADPYFKPAVKGSKIPKGDYDALMEEMKMLRDTTAGPTQDAYDKTIRYIERAANDSGDGSIALTANGLNQIRANFWHLRKSAPASAGSDFKKGYDTLKEFLPGEMQEGLAVSKTGYGKLDELDKSTLGRLAGIENPDQFRTALFKLPPDEFARVIKAMPDEGGALVRDYINHAAAGVSDANAKGYAARLYNKLMGSENQRSFLKSALGEDYQHVAGALEGAAEAPLPMTAGQLVQNLRAPAAQLANMEKDVLKKDAAKEFTTLLDQQLAKANPQISTQLQALNAAEAHAGEVNTTMGGLLDKRTAMAGSGDVAADVARIKAGKALAEKAAPGSWQNVQATLIDKITQSHQANGGALADKFFGNPGQVARWQAILDPKQYTQLRQGVLAYDEVAKTLTSMGKSGVLKEGGAAAVENTTLSGGLLERATKAARVLIPAGREQQYQAVLYEMKKNAAPVVKAFMDPKNAEMVRHLASFSKTDPRKLQAMSRFVTYATNSQVLQSTSQKYMEPESIVTPGGQ